MSLSRSVFKCDLSVNESGLEPLGPSSVDALRRVEAECAWSDATRLFAELALELHQPTEPGTRSG